MNGCPDHETLEAYLLGATSAAQLDSVAEHVRACPACLHRLHGLNEQTSPLVARLRRGRPAALEPAAEQALARLKQALPAPGEGELRELDEYRLLEPLGEGGMGRVYRALHTRLGKTVAVKVLAGRHGLHPAAAARFEREMKAVGALSHPNIVAAHDAGEAEGRLFLAMELAPGEDLARLVKRRGPPPAADACEIIRQAALGLAHAHKQGLVHRDVKPSNLILTPDGQVKVLDLGLALLKGEPPEAAEPDLGPAALEGTAITPSADVLTSVSCVMGTNDYMAPEQWQDSHRVDAKADLYSLGCTLFFLLTGKPPFDEGRPRSLHAKRQAHLTGAPPPLRPARLDRVVRRLLAKSPEDRFPNAVAVAAALRPLARGCDLPALLGESPGKGSPRRRGRWWMLGLLLGAGAVLWWLNRPPEAPAPGLLPMSREEAADLQRRWADHLREPVALENSLGMALPLIPPGEFGVSTEYRARLTRPYRLGAAEVTVGQFRAFVEASGHRTEPERSGLGGRLFVAGRRHDPLVRDPKYTWRAPGHPLTTDRHPVTQVAWVDAAAFCRWLGETEGRAYRLPTEAEWRWACRAGSAGQHPVEGAVAEIAWLRGSAGQPQPVGQLRPNAWGLYDVLGNVDEWCLDWHEEYPAGLHLDPAGPPTGTFKVHAGCSYVEVTASCNWRDKGGPGAATGNLGFRVLCEVGKVSDPRPLDDIRVPTPPPGR